MVYVFRVSDGSGLWSLRTVHGGLGDSEWVTLRQGYLVGVEEAE